VQRPYSRVCPAKTTVYSTVLEPEKESLPPFPVSLSRCLISPQPSTTKSIRSPPSLGRLFPHLLITETFQPSLRHLHFHTCCVAVAFLTPTIPGRGRIRLQLSLSILFPSLDELRSNPSPSLARALPFKRCCSSLPSSNPPGSRLTLFPKHETSTPPLLLSSSTQLLLLHRLILV
jgi:hypothetical protein